MDQLLFWNVTETATAPAKSPTRTSFFRSLIPRLVIGILLLLVVLWSHAVLMLVSYRWIDPPNNRGTHAAPLPGLDSQHALSRTLQVHSTQPDLPGSSACSNRCRGHAFLSA